MKKTLFKIFSVCLALLFCLPLPIFAEGGIVTTGEIESMTLPCVSAILMDAATGTVLFEQNADAALPPASVTKIMTLLLVMEAIDEGKMNLSDMVTVSAHAASMGGSQVYLKEGETMSVEEMLKCVIIASANDCAVALAEFTAGSEEAFVGRMNERAAELGMVNTHFENTNGLDDTAVGHLTSARDIAIMSKELISHPKILEYSGIWMDTIRDGAFGLTNTNRLVRFYPGCTGLKTGSTSKAKFCISATAQRDGLSLIAVIMAADTRDIRNTSATKLLDYGFANYSTFSAGSGSLILPVTGGVENSCKAEYSDFAAVVPKGKASLVETESELPASLAAPVEAGSEIGRIVYSLSGKEIGSVPVIATETVKKMAFFDLFYRLLQNFLIL